MNTKIDWLIFCLSLLTACSPKTIVDPAPQVSADTKKLMEVTLESFIGEWYRKDDQGEDYEKIIIVKQSDSLSYTHSVRLATGWQPHHNYLPQALLDFTPYIPSLPKSGPSFKIRGQMGNSRLYYEMWQGKEQLSYGLPFKYERR